MYMLFLSNYDLSTINYPGFTIIRSQHLVSILYLVAHMHSLWVWCNRRIRYLWIGQEISYEHPDSIESCPTLLQMRVAHAVLYSLTETEIETEMFCKTETKYKRKSESIKRNSNWNEIDFTTKMITQNVFKNLASHCFHLVILWQLTTFDYDTNKSLPVSLSQHLRHDGKLETHTDQYPHELWAYLSEGANAITFWSR